MTSEEEEEQKQEERYYYLSKVKSDAFVVEAVHFIRTTPSAEDRGKKNIIKKQCNSAN